jgi:hypothetical protein
MIVGPSKYSKDPNIVPEGIAITWSKEMIEEGYGSLFSFIRHFKESINDEEGYWCQKCKNEPQFDVAYVYIIFAGKIRYRVQYVGYESGVTTLHDAYGPKESGLVKNHPNRAIDPITI